MQTLTRAQVAERLGVTSKTLYTWEKEGKIEPPERDWRGWRAYTEAQVEALSLKLYPNKREKTPVEIIKPSPSSGKPRNELPALDISARNRLMGIIKSIEIEGVMAEVVLDLGAGNEIVSVITRSSIERLGLEVGSEAVALVKATEVMLAREI